MYIIHVHYLANNKQHVSGDDGKIVLDHIIYTYIILICPFHNYCIQLWNVINDINPRTQPLMYIATNKYHYFYSEHFQLSVKLMSSVTQEITVL